MSVGISASPLPRALTQQVDDGDGTPQAALPPTIKDAQGREYKLQADAASGLPQYRHAGQQRDQAGNTLDLEILITLATDGAFTRKTSQTLNLVNGDNQREVLLASFAADGTQVGEVVDSFSKEKNATTTEHTVGSFVAGKLVKRETDLEQQDTATDAKTKEVVTVGAKIHGVWDGSGQPITSATVPHVDKTETQRILSPGQGINKDTDRTIDFTAHGAGPLNGIDWDDAGKLVVRFNGRGGQYIEREMKVPLDQKSGSPNMDKAEVTRTDDKQNLVNKELMQARVWGGLVSNLGWFVGINFARGSLGKGFLALSAAAAGAQLTGEAHAMATQRNDADWKRLAVSAYDMLLTGMLAAYMTGRPDARGQLGGGARVALNAAGGTSLAIHGAQLGGQLGQVGTSALTTRMREAGVGADLLDRPGAPTALDGDWRAEPRFDAARALLG